MQYWLEIPSHVRRQIEALPNHVRPSVKKTIVALKDEPKPPEALAMTGELAGYYRIRVGIYRMVYTIHEQIVTVEVVRVAKRNN